MADNRDEIRLRRASEAPIVVRHLDAPPRFERPKRIHPRRLLPLVVEGSEREFHSATRPAAIARALPRAAAAGPDDLALVVNSELPGPAQQSTASNVDEPSAAVNGQLVFYTGNWYAALSTDSGATFRYLDPATAFQQFDPPGSSFCCDQVAHYIPRIDTFVWLLQYGPDTGDNIQRLAFAKSADFAAGHWHLFDITTDMLDVRGAFMDFPDLAVGANSLYVTTNLFGPGNQAGSAVVRLPLAAIAAGQPTASKFVSFDLQSFRVAQYCGATALFAAHEDTSTLRLFGWDEASAEPTSAAIGVARWIGGNGYQSRTADGHRWLDRCDPRITGATMVGNEVWFAWTVDRGSNQRPRPFVQIARIDASNQTLLENINVFDNDSAIAYGALSTNTKGEVGISYAIGGGNRNPSHVVGILTGARRDVVVEVGQRGPLANSDGKGEWGDFLTVRRAEPNGQLFAATGYTMKGMANGSNRDVTPRFVVFGRRSDVAAAGGAADAGGGTGTGGGGAGGGGTGGAGGGEASAGPITDVNSLPIVSSEVAAKVKAAAGILQGTSAPHEMEIEQPELVTKPGVERWPVKTGTDQDVAKVGKNVISGHNLGLGIVETTVEELVSVPRPASMPEPAHLVPAFQNRRAAPVETTIWRITGRIIAIKLETDGDYHLVVQGASGETMIAEIPAPTKAFVGNSPWIKNMKDARGMVDQKFVVHLNPADFVPMGKMLVPRPSLSTEVPEPPLPQTFVAADFQEDAGAELPAFKTAVTPTMARITGVGFFDKVHGQMGVSQANGIELHPVLKIEWV